MPHYKDQAGKLHFLDDAAFEHLLPDGCVEITDDEAAAIHAALNPPPTPNQQIDAQIVSIEQVNPITHRTMREFILGVSTSIAAAQGVTPAQLLNPTDPHYSHAFAAFYQVNAQTVALRGKKT